MEMDETPEKQPLLNQKMEQNDKKELKTQVFVERPALTIHDRQKTCLYEPLPPKGLGERLKDSARKCCCCSKERFLRFLYLRLPILEWLTGYDVKNWLLGDVVAGITIAIMHIPQGMGFALLAHVPAICGIYMAFYQSLIYAFLATSRHNSMGSFAVITLMTGKVVKELATFPTEGGSMDAMNEANVTDEFMETMKNATDSMELMGEGVYTPIQIATVVTFMVGIWHMAFGLLQLGTLAVFLSDMLVSGFTTAAAVHVLTSQVKDMLGIFPKGFSGPFKIIFTYIEFGRLIPTANILSIIITVVTVSVLVINNEVLKPIVAKYSKVPIPIELIAVVSGTCASYFANLKSEYGVEIVGEIPTGLPPAEVPPLELLGRVCVDSFVIAVVSYTINFSLAKIFAAKHGYAVDATQELYATGVGNIFSSFFSCPPTGSALARALVQDAVGGVTQLVSLIVCGIIILVLLFIGPLFQTLPKAVLASIIVVALKGMFMQVKDMVAMWKVSKVEAFIWLITFFSTVLIDIDFGLLIGVVFSLLVLLTKNQRPTTMTVGRVPDTDLYLDMNVYYQAKEVPGVRIFKIVGAIHFANRENLKTAIVKGTGLDPKTLAASKAKKSQEEKDKEMMMLRSLENGSCVVEKSENLIKRLLVDVSGVSYVDSAGGKFLSKLRQEYEKGEVTMCLAGLSENVLEIMEKSGCLKEFPSEHLFHSVHDAVTILTTQNYRF